MDFWPQNATFTPRTLHPDTRPCLPHLRQRMSMQPHRLQKPGDASLTNAWSHAVYSSASGTFAALPYGSVTAFTL